VCLIFLMLVGGVLAMEDSIRVKTEAGNSVKLYAWTAGSGPLLTSDNGVADENGIVEKTFFTLTVPTAKFQVIVLSSSGNKIAEGKFDNWATSDPIEIDCTSGYDCTISVYTEEAAVANDSVIADENDSAEENLEVLDSVNSTSSSFVELSKVGEFFSKRVYFYWGVGVLIFLVIVFLFWKKGFRVSVNSEEKELEALERKIKERKAEIERVRSAKDRKKKISEAKSKLASEEKELAGLKKDRVSEAKSKLASEEKELKELEGKKENEEEDEHKEE